MLHSYVTLGPIYQAILLNALKINTILQTYPLNGTWRQHLAVTTDTKTGEDCTVVCHPTLEGLVIHSGGFGKLVFVGRFHGCVGVCIALQRYDKSERNANKNAFIFISERTSSSTWSRYDIFTTFTRNVTTNFRLFSGLIWTYLDISGQKWTMAPATVVPLHRQSGTTCRRGRIYSSAEEKLPLGGAAEN